MIPFIISLFIATVACVCIICRFEDIVLRTGLVIIVVLASLISFWLITLYAGKPLETNMPEDTIVYGHAIDIKGKKIYILQRKINDDFPPVLIEIEYNKELGKALKAGSEQSGGKPFRLKKKGGEAGTGEPGENQGEGDGEGEGEGSLSQESETWDIMPLPPPKMPQKNTLDKSEI